MSLETSRSAGRLFRPLQTGNPIPPTTVEIAKKTAGNYCPRWIYAPRGLKRPVVVGSVLPRLLTQRFMDRSQEFFVRERLMKEGVDALFPDAALDGGITVARYDDNR